MYRAVKSISREGEKAMILRDYVNQRLDEGENNAVIEGLQNSVRCNLVDAVNNVPRADWEAEISNRQKESDGQTLIWLEGSSDPSYSIQE
jgi:hypothetical protein